MARILLLLLLLLSAPASAEIYTWVDEAGVPHIVDDPAEVPEAYREKVQEGRAGVRDLWPQGLQLPPSERLEPPAGGGVEEERVSRLLRGAVADLERGESARATAALESALRLDPKRPEPHWYLALLDRQRGRFDAAGAHLQAFLAVAGPEFGAWRNAAEQRLAALEDERRLADTAHLAGSDAWVGVAHPHFRVHYDAELGKSSPDYAATVLRYLEEAYETVGQRLGALPAEPIGVKFYGKAAYLRAHRDRFSFQTVGFFDGRMHVVSAGHPAGELRALLFHEYTHAVFREQTGGDRPFWLNEGMAELSERSSRKQVGLSRSERALLRRRIDAGRWLSLERLAPSFGGLENSDARAAYLISTAAAWWIEQRTQRAQRARLLELLGQGLSDDEALGRVLGLDTAGIDAAVQRWILSEFPALPAGLGGL